MGTDDKSVHPTHAAVPTPPAAPGRDEGSVPAAVGIVLTVLTIGIGTGVSVGLATESVLLGIVLGIAGTVAPVLVLWVLFVPLKRWTMKVLRPLLNAAAVEAAARGAVSLLLRWR